MSLADDPAAPRANSEVVCSASRRLWLVLGAGFSRGRGRSTPGAHLPSPAAPCEIGNSPDGQWCATHAPAQTPPHLLSSNSARMRMGGCCLKTHGPAWHTTGFTGRARDAPPAGGEGGPPGTRRSGPPERRSRLLRPQPVPSSTRGRRSGSFVHERIAMRACGAWLPSCRRIAPAWTSGGTHPEIARAHPDPAGRGLLGLGVVALHGCRVGRRRGDGRGYREGERGEGGRVRGRGKSAIEQSTLLLTDSTRSPARHALLPRPGPANEIALESLSPLFAINIPNRRHIGRPTSL